MSVPDVTTTREAVRAVVELACRAPSVHNTQPWIWRTTPYGVDLLADESRHLAVSDPTGRNMVISCGCAQHHAQVVAAALGWETRVTRLPDGMSSDRLASIELQPATPSPDAEDVLRSVRERCTDRRRFTSRPVAEGILHDLARLAGRWGAHAVPVVDVTDRFRLDRLADRARDHQARDERVAREQQTWVDHGPTDGIPSAVVPASDPSTSLVRDVRFAPGRLQDPDAEFETSDGVILLCGYDDTRADWLRTGEALSALWLRATLTGLSVVPLSQVIEVDETRSALQHEVLGGLAVPHLLVRLGWEAPSRSRLEHTARRPVDDVLVVS